MNRPRYQAEWIGGKRDGLRQQIADDDIIRFADGEHLRTTTVTPLLNADGECVKLEFEHWLWPIEHPRFPGDVWRIHAEGARLYTDDDRDIIWLP